MWWEQLMRSKIYTKTTAYKTETRWGPLYTSKKAIQSLYIETKSNRVLGEGSSGAGGGSAGHGSAPALAVGLEALAVGCWPWRVVGRRNSCAGHGAEDLRRWTWQHSPWVGGAHACPWALQQGRGSTGHDGPWGGGAPRGWTWHEALAEDAAAEACVEEAKAGVSGGSGGQRRRWRQRSAESEELVEESERELREGGNEGGVVWWPLWEQGGPHTCGRDFERVSPADLRSSIRASLSSRAEGPFSGELGSAWVRKPGYNWNCKVLDRDGKCWVGLGYQTHPCIKVWHPLHPL
jgi:hypothetical protein